METYKAFQQFFEDLTRRRRQLSKDADAQRKAVTKAEQAYRNALADGVGVDDARQGVAAAKERLTELEHEKKILETVPENGSPRLTELAEGVRDELQDRMEVTQANFDAAMGKARAARAAFIESLQEVGSAVAEGHRLESISYKVVRHLPDNDVPALRGEAFFSRDLAIDLGQQQNLFNGRA